MRIVMKNSAGCELQTWETQTEFVRDMQRGYVVFNDGDHIAVQDNTSSWGHKPVPMGWEHT